MTPNQQSDMKDNELIAEFMKWRRHENGKAFWVPNTYPMDGNTGHTTDHPDNFQFNSRWDWLMPVVEKIKQLYNDSEDLDFRQNVLEQRIFNTSILMPIAVVYNATVEFIKWYNSKTK